MKMNLIAALAPGIPVWAFTLATSLIMILLALLGWFIRREFQKYDNISNIINGHVSEKGEYTKGLLEKIEEIEFKIVSHGETIVSCGEKGKTMNDTQASIENSINDFKKEIESINQRVISSEDWMIEEGERNRKAIRQLEEKTDDSRQELSEIKGKLDTLIAISSKKTD